MQWGASAASSTDLVTSTEELVSRAGEEGVVVVALRLVEAAAVGGMTVTFELCRPQWMLPRHRRQGGHDRHQDAGRHDAAVEWEGGLFRVRCCCGLAVGAATNKNMVGQQHRCSQ